MDEELLRLDGLNSPSHGLQSPLPTNKVAGPRAARPGRSGVPRFRARAYTVGRGYAISSVQYLKRLRFKSPFVIFLAEPDGPTLRRGLWRCKEQKQAGPQQV